MTLISALSDCLTYSSGAERTCQIQETRVKFRTDLQKYWGEGLKGSVGILSLKCKNE